MKILCPGTKQPLIAKVISGVAIPQCAQCGRLHRYFFVVGDLAPRHFKGTQAFG